jgi:uncharacterized protein YkwD
MTAPYRLFVPGLAADSLRTIPESFLALLNAERQKAGVAPLRGHPVLDLCAADRVADMIAQGNLADTYTGRLTAHGVTSYAWAGENLAMVNSTEQYATRMIELWMASPGHRANILAPEFDTVGTGHGRNAAGVHLVANIFTGGANLP